jgi:multidrug efflux pump subunit AcrA (membrane-fusion protein)
MREDDTPTTKLPAESTPASEPESTAASTAETTAFSELIDGAEPDPDAEEKATEADTSRVSGWGRVLRGNRALWIVALIAVVCLVVGLLVGRFLMSPDASSADAPEPGLVTAPVDFGPLSNDVTLRADVGYADAVEVKLDTSAFSGAAVVTGQVPEVGATLTPLSIALEVVGRPVIVLPGELPSYRTLRFGVSGPDVLQLKQALTSVGIGVGDVNSNVFDRATADAVAQLYAQAGYPVPSPEDGASDGVRAAEEGVRAAQTGVTEAQKALNEAGAGPSAVETWQADVKLAAAQQALAKAQGGDGDVQQAQWDLQTAQLERDELRKGRDTSAQRSALDSARAQVTSANQALEEARQKALPYLPASEVLYLTELPRRVDAVGVERGSVLSGSAMTVSGATVRLTGAAAEADAALLTAGAEGSFELPDGTAHRAVISELKAGKDNKARWEVLLDPDPLTPEQITQLQGKNVRVKLAIGATDGDVLSVPLAALTAGPGGESRVEVVESDPREGKDAKTRLVVVETGLAAKGAVEVTAVDGGLEENDLVVVGR